MNITSRLKKTYRKAIAFIFGDDGKLSCPLCMSKKIFTIESYRKTGGPRVYGKRITYGYRFYRHSCEECLNAWENKK